MKAAFMMQCRGLPTKALMKVRAYRKVTVRRARAGSRKAQRRVSGQSLATEALVSSLSEYEIRRRETIASNEAMMLALGITKPAPAPRAKVEPAHTKVEPAHAKTPKVDGPRRTCARFVGAVAPDYTEVTDSFEDSD